MEDSPSFLSQLLFLVLSRNSTAGPFSGGWSEREEILLGIWDREFQTTVKVFKSFPRDRLDVKPHEPSRSVRDLAWQCALDERVIEKILDDQNDLRSVVPNPRPPETMEEIVAA